MMLGQLLAQFDKTRINGRFATGNVKQPALSGVIETVHPLLGSAKYSDLGPEIGGQAVAAAIVAGCKQNPVCFYIVLQLHAELRLSVDLPPAPTNPQTFIHCRIGRPDRSSCPESATLASFAPRLPFQERTARSARERTCSAPSLAHHTER